MTYGIAIPLDEHMIADLGEQTALDLARRHADRLALTQHGSSDLIEHDVDVQTVPVTDPDTGHTLPPMRLYRFRYR